MTDRLQTAAAVACLGACLALAGCGPPGTPADDVPATSAAPATPPREPAPDSVASVGQTVYVAVYSHIFHQDGSRELDLTTTLSVRNVDPDRPITVASIGYYDSSGRLVRRYAERPFRLGPLASEPFVVEDRDRTGGVGASFLVEWTAGAEVSPPLVEAVMISTEQTQGVSLVSRGRVVRTLGDTAAVAPVPRPSP